jgi:hypothetical protein
MTPVRPNSPHTCEIFEGAKRGQGRETSHSHILNTLTFSFVNKNKIKIVDITMNCSSFRCQDYQTSQVGQYFQGDELGYVPTIWVQCQMCVNSWQNAISLSTVKVSGNCHGRTRMLIGDIHYLKINLIFIWPNAAKIVYVCLYNIVFMVLRDVMAAPCADRTKHTVAAGNINSARRYSSTNNSRSFVNYRHFHGTCLGRS